MIELCPFCRNDLHVHCGMGHPTCTWLTCKRDEGGCGAVIDPAEFRAVRDGASVAWPHTLPGQ